VTLTALAQALQEAGLRSPVSRWRDLQHSPWVALRYQIVHHPRYDFRTVLK
jgi:hypothetical protein